MPEPRSGLATASKVGDLPRNVEVRGAAAQAIRAPESGEVPLPVVTITATSRFGEIEFVK